MQALESESETLAYRADSRKGSTLDYTRVSASKSKINVSKRVISHQFLG